MKASFSWFYGYQIVSYGWYSKKYVCCLILSNNLNGTITPWGGVFFPCFSVVMTIVSLHSRRKFSKHHFLLYKRNVSRVYAWRCCTIKMNWRNGNTPLTTFPYAICLDDSSGELISVHWAYLCIVKRNHTLKNLGNHASKRLPVKHASIINAPTSLPYVYMTTWKR